ncbi:GspH/FimT family pseudopilin [Reinekea thalattae]|nr:GspH/FimT family pseudopilin [Reinekea thalattae]
MNKQLGFSLLELLIAISILMLALSAALPSLSDFKHRIESDLERAHWLQLLNYARAIALNNQQRLILCPMENNVCSSDTAQPWVLFTDPDKSKSLDVDAGETRLRQYQPSAQTRFGYYSAGVPYFRFGNDSSDIYQGMPEGFTICPFGTLDQTAWHLTVSITGRITLYNERDAEGRPLRNKSGQWVLTHCDT